MKSTIFSLLIAFAIAGCGSSTSGPSEKVVAVQRDPVVSVVPVLKAPEKLVPQVQEVGFGTVVISRDTTHPDPGCMIGVFLNKQMVHQFDAEQKATFILPAGDQVVAVNNSDGRSSCAVVAGEPHQLAFRLKSGDVKNWHVQLQPGKGAVIEATER
ncbi:hypothetical protein [Glaciimonas immobilis]|uniref:Lipoprotein n=1 Tax=Glaciimonas immobilis TaxID=728004 RepID=A0A840RV22_9BURK|nr:hypothetical protein [Glaciimonas immobilis]KAF3999831.1 hypothetical protein HAV38_01180 [Glaciimonas immobilis]MBB5200309.1 hypothetical protein [Glaciimonas immobilis]